MKLKIKIDLVTVVAYIGLTWAYFSILPEPNGWVYGIVMMFAVAIDMRSYSLGLDHGGALMQKIMKDTLEDGNWEIVRKAK